MGLPLMVIELPYAERQEASLTGEVSWQLSGGQEGKGYLDCSAFATEQGLKLRIEGRFSSTASFILRRGSAS